MGAVLEEELLKLYYSISYYINLNMTVSHNIPHNSVLYKNKKV